MRSRVARAFTLVEVISVAMIVGLLIAMLLPALAKARSAAAVTICGAQLGQVGKAIHCYAGESKSRIPAGPRPEHAFDIEGTSPFATSMVRFGLDHITPRTSYTGLGLLLKLDFLSAEPLFCPADDTFELSNQLESLGEGKTTWGSYLYRHLDYLPAGCDGGSIDNLGSHRVGGREIPVRALVVEAHSRVTMAGPAGQRDYYQHTNHESRMSNILYVDGSARAFDNRSGALTWTDELIDELGVASVPLILDQTLLAADWAYQSGSIADGPRLFPTVD